MNSGEVPSRRGAILVFALGGYLMASALGGCSQETRQKLLPVLFDGVPTGQSPAVPPPTQRVRRDLLQEVDDLKRKLAEAEAIIKAGREAKPTEEPQRPAEKAKTWDEAAEVLPKASAGGVDWVKAIEGGAISPRPGLDSKALEQAPLDLDLDLASSRSKLFAATYPHSAHTKWLTCSNCHPAIFPLGRGSGPTTITMAGIRAGEQCGVCHGKVAFSVDAGCARCHRKIPAKDDWQPGGEPRKPIEKAKTWDEVSKLLPVTAGGPDWAKAMSAGEIAPQPGADAAAADQPVFPITVERTPPGQPALKAVFPHAAHTAWLGCTNCHPARFQMKAGATPINMGLIFAGQACGECHGKVAFAVATGCPRCHPAMAGGK